MSQNPLHIAVWAGTASDNVDTNAALIADALHEAAKQEVDLVATPECVLSGYPGCARANCQDIDYEQLQAHEQKLQALARDLGMGLLLGSVSHDTATGWTNDLIWCDPEHSQPQRYRKRCLTPMDREHFIAGTQAVSVDFRGWRLGLSICFDVRFADIWADCALADSDCCINVAHMAGSNDDHGAKRTVIPAFYCVRAAEWATPVVLCNTGAEDRWLDSGWWDHRGALQGQHGQGLAYYHIEPRPSGEHWHQDLRQQQLKRWQQRRP